jgi:hypothetical protein
MTQKLGTTPTQAYGKPSVAKFDTAGSYNQFDRVEWQGAVYGCKQDGTKGSEDEPLGEPQDHPETWELLYGYRFTGDGVTSTTSDHIEIAGGGGSGYTLPVATDTVLGGVKIGDNLSITDEGVLSATGGGGSGYTLPVATSASLGGVKIGDNLNITNGYIYAPIASATQRGVVQIGSGLKVTSMGLISTDIPTMSTSAAGLAQIDAASGLKMNNYSLRINVKTNSGLTIDESSDGGTLSNTYKWVPTVKYVTSAAKPQITQSETYGYRNQRYDNITFNIPTAFWAGASTLTDKNLNNLKGQDTVGLYGITPSEWANVPEELKEYSGYAMLEVIQMSNNNESDPYSGNSKYNKFVQKITTWSNENYLDTSVRIYMREWVGTSGSWWTQWKKQGGELEQILDKYSADTLNETSKPQIIAGDNAGIMTVVGNVMGNEYGPLPGTFAIVLSDSLGMNKGDEFLQVVKSDQTSKGWESWNGCAVNVMLHKIEDNEFSEFVIGFAYADNITKAVLASDTSVTLTAGTYTVHIY